ncbi:MAG: nuclear transport factor 2 family protein [Gammaproteobacteria bacterium]|jgi:ketosteroid isomerase-like protein
MPQQLPVDALFAALDRKDLGTFLSFLAPDCRLRYGSYPVVEGQDAIRDTVSRFLEQIAESRHEIAAEWHCDDAVICHGEVHYTRRDGTAVSIPAAYIMSLDEGMISEYRAFLETSALFAEAS